MRIRVLAFCLVLAMLLSGCGSWMDGSYSSANLHQSSQNQTGVSTPIVSSYEELRQTLIDLVENGTDSLLLNVEHMEPETIDLNTDKAIAYILESNPIAAYAVESIEYEQGTSGGLPALSVTVHYNQNVAALRTIKEANDMAEAQDYISSALDQCETKLVMRVDKYQTADFEEYVRKYMENNPQTVMELPTLTVNTFPETGIYRVVEITFTYQTSREDLKIMQNRVRPLFTSAELYVAGNNTAYEQFELLYAFLMERHDYQFEASITPFYSLLVHGVGNSKAFSIVYAAMCRRADLECMVVSGTRNGESWFWNIVCVDGVYHHLDLLSAGEDSAFALRGDEEMNGYVWDYSAYPKCHAYGVTASQSEPTQEPASEPEIPAGGPSGENTEPTETFKEETEPEEPPGEDTVPQETFREETEPDESSVEDTENEEN